MVIVLFGCLLPLPYGYYEFVRLFCTIGFFSLAVDEYKANRIYLFAPLTICVLLFNFLVPIHFERNVWQIIDVVVGSLAFIWLLIEIATFINKKE